MFNENYIKSDKGKNKDFIGYYIDKNGYKYIFKPSHPNNVNNYVPEHRLIIELQLKRYLNKDELVHHKDSNKLNNSIENLEVMTKSNHRALHNILDKKGKLHYNIELVKKLYLEGLSCRDIANKLNIGKSTVALYVKNLGISRPNIQYRTKRGFFGKR